MIDLVKRYISKKIELIKIEVIEKSAHTAGSVIIIAVAGTFISFFFLLLNLGIAFWIGEELNKLSFGFLIVASFYLLLAVIIFILKKYLKLFFVNLIIKVINIKN
ncbi:phage holin family protein [Chryseobacterium sp. KACC 21268]|nr:phage holin family protein [Chryseobacterium sp. KACC 21268]